LTTDEIVDQYRFWCAFLEARGEKRTSIVNIVFMGMGEPLQNYDAVRETCSTLLAFTELGPTHIVVSTVGVRHAMEKLLTDPLWPPVRIAISLHSAIEETRKKIVPSHVPGFLKFLEVWAKEYHKKFPEKRRHLSLEYVLLKNVNDDEKNAEALCSFAGHMGKVKVNLIFWNPVAGADFTRSIPDAALSMQKLLKDHDILCTIRDTQGQDIDAACGQLIIQSNKKTGT
jgi:23S rRNA (adenine2503-C2)-methyltransferase